MSIDTAAMLRRRLDIDDQVDMGSLRTTTDKELSIGQDVWRLRWRGQLTTAVAGDADLHTTCGALLDALALFERASGGTATAGEAEALDLSTINLLIDRPLPGDHTSETDEALRSMRDAIIGVKARIWYQRAGTGWTEDVALAPTWPKEDPQVAKWVNKLLLPRLTAQPGQFALALVEAVDDPSLHLYPSEIKAGRTDIWALRLDGLEIGTASNARATLTIGQPGETEDGPARKIFADIFGQSSVLVSDEAASLPETLNISQAAEGIRALLRRFRRKDVRGAPITYRAQGDIARVDEHALEARLLKGIVRLKNEPTELVLDDDLVARGSQFPTLWGHGSEPRYLDALLRHGTTPLAVELKVATGGQGRYYRRALVQSVLYQHFIRNAPGLDPWFETAGLDRMATEGAIGIPTPRRWTPGFQKQLDLHRRVAARVGAAVYVLDDRAAPDWVATKDLDEPRAEQLELLSWRMAAALSNRWPRSLGRIVEVHGAGGLYDQIELQGLSDRSLTLPSPGPRISLNRPGSLWVLSQSGSPSWTWREIWEYLAHEGSADEASEVVGAMAGLGMREPLKRPTFAQMAVDILEASPPLSGWSWRCASLGGHETSQWVERFRVPLRQYSRTPTAVGRLPTIARIWGAVRDGAASVIVDQENLRTWIWDGEGVQNLDGLLPRQRIKAAVAATQ
jgi:hypothetical protein